MGRMLFRDFQSHRRVPAPSRSTMRRALSMLLPLGVLALTIAGCSVQDHKNGESENVRLRTPLGGLDVRTNAVHGSDVGLPVYPGAVETLESGDDSKSADVSLNFGDWRLHVKAVGYRSSDPQDKIVAFYKKALSQYGDVLTCQNRTAVGQPAATRQGLTCANDHEYTVNMRIDTPKTNAGIKLPQISGHFKLLAGSPQNQHLVEFTPSSNGTKFTLVTIELPHKAQTD